MPPAPSSTAAHTRGAGLEQLGKYQLLRRLAVGGMAELYLASATGPKGFKRRLVLKKILPQYAHDPSFIEMFLGEARIAGQLSHPNLAQVYEVGEVEGAYFIAMEYVDGPNLRTLAIKARQAGKPLPVYLAARIIAYACDGLGHAHEHADPETGQPLRIIHRDISPDNIVIAYTGSVKVLDFGIAKATSQHHHTKTGVVKGKVAYMAPEQMARQPLDHRADIYSLGVVLYELLAGARPYDAQDELSLLHARVTQQPLIPLAARRPDVPGKLCEIVEKALARAPEQRHASCRELQGELEKFLHQAAEPVGTRDIARLVAELHAEPDWGQLPAAPPAAPEGPDLSRHAPPEERTTAPGTPPPAVAHTEEATAPGGPSSTRPGPRRERPARTRAPLAVAAAVFLAGAGVLAVRPLLGGAPATAAPAVLTVESIPAATVRVGQQEGPSPFTLEVEPGSVQVEAYDRGLGFSKVERIELGPGERRTLQVKVAQVEVVFRSLPEAQVFVGGRRQRSGEGDMTPIRAVLYEGTHQVHFRCVNGVEDRREIAVSPAPDEQRIDGNCRSGP